MGERKLEDILITFVDLLKDRLRPLIDLPGKGEFLLLLLFFGLEEFRRKNRDEGERAEKRGHEREANGIGHLYEEQRRDPFDEGQGDKDHDAGDGGRDDGSAYLLRTEIR